MLKFGELPCLEQLETEFNGLNIIIEGTVMHEMEEVNGEVLYPKLEPNNSRQRRNPMPNNIPLHLIELHNSRI